MGKPLRCLTSAAAASAVLAAPYAAPASEICRPRYYFEEFFEDDLKRFAMAHVYPSGREELEAYAGTAFVIDAQLGLALTARHVVAAATGDRPTVGDAIDLYFPGINGGATSAATIIATLQTARALSQDDADERNFARDIALLKLEDEDVISALHGLRLSFGDERYSNAVAYSFFGAASRPYENPVALSVPEVSRGRPALCTLNLDGTVAHGDSGGPVVDQESGHAVGMVLTYRFVGGRVQGEVLPTYCIRDLIAEWVSEHFSDAVNDAMERLVDDDVSALAEYLRAAHGTETLSNARFQSAMIQWANYASQPETVSSDRADRLLSNYFCPIQKAMQARLVTLDADDEMNLVTMLAGDRTLREAADEQLREARAAERNGQPDAHMLAIQSSGLYNAAYQSTLSESLERPLVLVQPSDVAEEQRDQIAKTLKGLSDSLYLAAETQGANPDSQLYFASAEAALQSAAFAGELSPEVGAQALSTYASAATRLGEYGAAAEGLAVAYASGADAQWIVESYDFNMYRAFEASHSEASTDYRPIDQAFDVAPPPGDFAVDILRNFPLGAVTQAVRGDVIGAGAEVYDFPSGLQIQTPPG